MPRLFTILHYLLRRNFVSFLIIVIITGKVTAQNSIPVLPLTAGAQDNFTSFTPQKFYKDRAKLLRLTPAKYTGNPDFGKSFIDKQFEDSTAWYERINKRTLKSRTYVNINKPSQIIVQNGYSNLNYVDENGWLRAVDLKLKPAAYGWCAAQQEIPVYLYPDAGTALSLGHGQLMTFNKNVTFNNSSISTTDHSVGDNGMYIKNAAPNTDKIIRFGRGAIETDYRINKPLKLTGDLIISEDIILPAGYSISENTTYNPDIDQPGSLIVKSVDGKIVAEFKTPRCYDNAKGFIAGVYHVQRQQGEYRLDIHVPSAWLNDSLCCYPVTIDPQVTGPTTLGPNNIIPSCFSPNYSLDSMIIIIPPEITITNFYFQGNFMSVAPADKGDGKMYVTTSCGDTGFLSDPGNTIAGELYAPLEDLLQTDKLPLTCCFPPSCNTQVFTMYIGISRTDSGSSCNATYIYYDPANPYPLEAYIVGNTVESNTDTAGAGWAVSSNYLCSNNCTLTLTMTTINGVPPYTISHPWAAQSVTYGLYSKASCSTLGTGTSTGTVNLPLTIPGCPAPPCNSTSISVPPPVVVDACGDTIQGLTAITVNLNSVPDVIVTPGTETICSDSTINLSIQYCVAGSTLAWKGSDGTSGSEGIVDAPVNNGSSPVTVTYTVTATTDSGCMSNAVQAQVIVNPLPVISTAPSLPSICPGDSIELTAGGAATYTWSPSAGLSATTGDSVVADSPGSTYNVIGTNANGCIGKTSVTVTLAPSPVITVSPPSSTVCIGTNATLTAGGASTYTWEPSTGLNSINDSSVTVTPTITTIYTVTGTSSSGCIDSTTVLVTLGTLPQVAFFMIVPSNCDPQLVQFTDTLPGGVNYFWDFGDGRTGASSNPSHSYVSPGNYTVKLQVTDSQGCIDSSSVSETILPAEFVVVPNAFTPGGNTADNYFTPYMLCTDYSNYVFNVYNRWGQLVFQTNDATQGWDGRFNGTPEQIGVYIYYVQFNCGNCQILKQGNITLLK